MQLVTFWALVGVVAAETCADHEASVLLQLRDNVTVTDVDADEEEVACAKIPEHSCASIYGQPFQASTSQSRDRSGGDLAPADCPLCKLGAGEKRATFYAVERRDGLGERAANLINMMALAAKVGMNFGGLLKQEKQESHGVYIPISMTELLGTSYRRILQKAKAPHFDHCYFVDEQKILDAAAHAPWQPGQDVLFVGCITGMVHNGDLLTPSFLAQLRESTPLMRRATPHFKTQKLRVAMHLRRGDLHVGSNRGMPDEQYHSVLDAVQPLVGDAEFHVFSTTEKNYKPSDFNSYSNRGMDVHLDGDEVDDWAHMMQADVLLLSPSSFAWVPGIFNPHCVVGFSRYYPMGHWAVHQDGDFSHTALAQLQKCVEGRKAERAKHGESQL